MDMFYMIAPCRIMKLDSYCSPYTKLTWFKDFNIKYPESAEGEVGNTFELTGSRKDFMNRMVKA